ncbi:1-hydroxycarotenoid 3,4-desaturase CrtD [Yoonia sp. 208BN28-4]|uniref:1-hydroxycarotenoid 3,4-desaturase CrtD n=1 Tax=Yoonia sp. 208BN28-4 TaxID=3126505 RepID=UPI0030B6133B
MGETQQKVTIIGAGIGGLAAALRLAHAGLRVTVLERHATPGGKMRTLPTNAGPVDAGPTVLTMKSVFDSLFADVGERLVDHVTMLPEHILARHFWRDGTRFDLTADTEANVASVRHIFGNDAARAFTNFTADAQMLFDAFDTPMMRSAAPSQADLTRRVLQNPALIPRMAPHRSMFGALNKRFKEPRLAQLFARYATYVGGLPAQSPAILNLVSAAEAQGVWHVEGGMHALAVAIESLASKFGAKFYYGADVQRIEMQDGRVNKVRAADAVFDTDLVLFNGDPRALVQGRLGPLGETAVPKTATEPRSLSACVASFAAVPDGLPLAGHNVLFADDPAQEYLPLANGNMQTDPTLYICAQDRFGGRVPNGPERFEIIMNAAPAPDGTMPDPKENERCQSLISERLRRMGLTFSPIPTAKHMTTPAMFDQLFPASNGSLYGRSPHGLMAAFKRPTARTEVKGLYLVGGGAHPGAGVPMATLSAQHAAAAILSDLSSTSTFPLGVMRGGMSTA